MRRVVCLLCVVAASSGPANAEAVYFLHATPASSGLCNAVNDATLSCGSVNNGPDGFGDTFVWVIVGDVGSEIGGAQFGVEYDSGVQVALWQPCTGGEQIPQVGWPASGTGNVLTYSQGCYRPPGNLAKVGFFYVSSGSVGAMRITDDPRFGEAMTFGCGVTGGGDGGKYPACDYNGSLVFGGGTGYLPADCRCSGPPTVDRTWTTIKDSYRNQ